jgi:hypothetical protein
LGSTSLFAKVPGFHLPPRTTRHCCCGRLVPAPQCVVDRFNLLPTGGRTENHRTLPSHRGADRLGASRRDTHVSFFASPSTVHYSVLRVVSGLRFGSASASAAAAAAAAAAAEPPPPPRAFLSVCESFFSVPSSRSDRTLDLQSLFLQRSPLQHRLQPALPCAAAALRGEPTLLNHTSPRTL